MVWRRSRCLSDVSVKAVKPKPCCVVSLVSPVLFAYVFIPCMDTHLLFVP